MVKCLVKINTRCLLLSILYVAGIFHSFANSSGVIKGSSIHTVNRTWSTWTLTQNSSNTIKSTVNVNSGPKICQQRIITHINNRYATTVVTTRVINPVNKAQEYIFSFVFPENAFLSGFVIEINGKNFTSYILENEEARKQYKSVGISGSSNLPESAVVRNTQKISIPINLEASSLTTLYLTYEELLNRDHGRYEHVLNIFPGQVVEDLFVEIILKETKQIKNLKVPKLRTGNEIENQHEELDPQAFISEDHHSGVVKSYSVLFMPNEEEQRKFARFMKTNENHGFAGQFVVQYDVENNKESGEIIVSNGYFANFFAPQGLDPLTKHVVFVLDTSGSMKGKRIEKLKVAMTQMLNQLRENDLMSLVEFNKVVQVWNLESKATVTYSTKKDLNKISFPKPLQANPANIKKAIDCVKGFNAVGGTDILSGLKVGLKLVEVGKKFDKIQRQPLIMFLTDGQPTVGEKSPQQIIEKVTKFNSDLKRSPLSTLAFGNSANEDLLQNLAINNMGYFKHIYDAEDSQLQIEDFFNTISVPVLANINFNYDSSALKNVTSTKFPVFYDGSEIIVAGQYDSSKVFNKPVIEALAARGPLDKEFLKKEQVYNSTTDISHLWAFLTTKQSLDKIRTKSEKNWKEYKEKALDASLKYSFVTSLSSMVVVKPDEKVVLGSAELTVQSNANPRDSIIDENMKLG